MVGDGVCEDLTHPIAHHKVLDGPASEEKGSKGRNQGLGFRV